jgi:hypothetical protein
MVVRVRELGGLAAAEKQWEEMHTAWEQAKGEQKQILEGELTKLGLGIKHAKENPASLNSAPATDAKGNELPAKTSRADILKRYNLK